MAEVFVVGRLVGASGFPDPSLFCKWSISAGTNWRLLEGEDHGQTQVDNPKDGEMAIWSHPIDFHYATKGMQGWPKLKFEVYQQDMFGRNSLAGYGVVHIPTSAGPFNLDCVTWRPAGTVTEQVSNFFLGDAPELKNSELVVSSADRFRLRTSTAGKVHLEIGIVLKDFDKFGVAT